MSEALELRIEHAWIELCGYAKSSTKVTLYLTPRAAIWGFGGDRNRCMPKDCRVVGTYTKAITLADFRSDVFHVYDEMTRGVCNG